MNEAYQMVKHFQKTAGQPVSEFPQQLSKERVSLRAKWILGELNEFMSASNREDQADALTDILYYLIGAYVEMGIRPDPLFRIVHDSNMKKINSPDGITKDETGKVLKPSAWKHPNDEIKEAIHLMEIPAQ